MYAKKTPPSEGRRRRYYLLHELYGQLPVLGLKIVQLFPIAVLHAPLLPAGPGEVKSRPRLVLSSSWSWQVLVSGTQVAVDGSPHCERVVALHGALLSEHVPNWQNAGGPAYQVPPLLKQSNLAVHGPIWTDVLPSLHTAVLLQVAKSDWMLVPRQLALPFVMMQFNDAAVSCRASWRYC